MVYIDNYVYNNFINIGNVFIIKFFLSGVFKKLFNCFLYCKNSKLLYKVKGLFRNLRFTLVKK